ncbi:hypothetical protein [Haloarchaeobius sp. DFWS5]|uniref:hypothetical protein n=1 Tax=Haloarchaeobius sp. DFWS5 TaxID=3446114 RepID=UPI003EB91C09
MDTPDSSIAVVGIIDGLVAVVGLAGILTQIGGIGSLVLSGLFAAQAVFAYGLFRDEPWAYGGAMAVHGFYSLLGLGAMATGLLVVGLVVLAVNLGFILAVRRARPAQQQGSFAGAVN